MRASEVVTTFIRPHPNGLLLLGCCQKKVFSRKPHIVDDMIHCLREACQETDDNKELCARMCLSVASRLQECVNNEGQQFEHL